MASSELTEEHRPTLERLLDLAKRGRDLETYTIRNLNEELLEAAQEGLDSHVEKVSRKVRAHRLTLDNREADIEALEAALAMIPKEDEQ